MAVRHIISEFIIEPGTGKAIELLKPDRSCASNRSRAGNASTSTASTCMTTRNSCIAAGRARCMASTRPRAPSCGPAPPRERALLYILEDTVGRNDVLFPRCSAYVYESAYGFDAHTNCHDIQAEAQREYGLTPDDVHDSFNLFMCTEMSRMAAPTSRVRTRSAGDHVDLLALVDVLAVPNVCGADVMRTSNFALKPIKLTVFEATEADLAKVPKTPVLKSQRTPRDFRNPTIKSGSSVAAGSRLPSRISQHADCGKRACRGVDGRGSR